MAQALVSIMLDGAIIDVEREVAQKAIDGDPDTIATIRSVMAARAATQPPDVATASETPSTSTNAGDLFQAESVFDLETEDDHSDETTDEKMWTVHATKTLLAEYAQRKNQFENAAMKKKPLWEAVGKKVKLGKKQATAQQAESRWKTLLRGYKKFLQNKGQTGKGRKEFAYKREMDELVAHRHDLFPQHLSGNDVHPKEPAPVTTDEDQPPPPKAMKKQKRAPKNEVLEYLKSSDEQMKESEEQRLQALKKMHDDKMSFMKELLTVLKKD